MNINLTLIGQTIVFIIFVWFCMKFIWPPIIASMNERKKRIENGLLAAERGFADKKEAEEKVQELINEAKKQAAEIITNANKQATKTIEGAKSIATTEADKIKNKASIDIEKEKSHVANELKEKLSQLVMQGVNKVLTKEVDYNSHKDMLNKLSISL